MIDISDDEYHSITRSSSIMYAIIAIILLWNATYFIDKAIGANNVDDMNYHLSVVILSFILLLFLFYILYKGLLSETLIVILVFLSVSSYSITYLINKDAMNVLNSAAPLVVGLLSVVVIALGKKRIPLAIACLLIVLESYLMFNLSDSSMCLSKGIMMLASGIIFAFYSGYMIYETMRYKIGFIDFKRAMNATVICETVGYIVLGSMMLYCVGLENVHFGTGDLVTEILVIISACIAIIIAIFSAVNGAITSGATIVSLTTFMLVSTFAINTGDVIISPYLCTIFVIPLMFTTYRFYRKGDKLLTTTVVISIILILSRCAEQYFNNTTAGVINDIIMVVVALMLFYVSFSRMVFIKTGRRYLPLFDGGSFVNDPEPWQSKLNHGTEESSMALQTYALISMMFLIAGLFLIDLEINKNGKNSDIYYIAMIILGLLTVVFSMDNLRKRRLTETMGAIFIGTSFLSLSICGIFFQIKVNQLDLIPILCIMICGIMFLLMKDYLLGVTFLLSSAGMVLIDLSAADASFIISGILLIAAGAIIMVRYSYIKLVRRWSSLTLTDREGIGEDVPLSKLIRVIGFTILGLTLIMIAFGSESDSKSLTLICILTGISTCVSIYGIMTNDSPGFLLIFVVSVIVFVQSLCFMFNGHATFYVVSIALLLAMIPITILFIKNRKTISASISVLLIFCLSLRVFTDWSMLYDTLFSIIGMAICLHALYHWALLEMAIGPVTSSEPSVYGDG